MHGESEEHEQSNGVRERQVLPQSGRQTGGVGGWLRAIHGSQGAYHGFSGDERSHESHADLPIEAQGTKRRFDVVAGVGEPALFDGSHVALMDWEVNQHPDRETDSKHNGSHLREENPSALDQQ